MRFKTRNEARQFCRNVGVPLSKISRDIQGDGLNWSVSAGIFEEGKEYELIDPNGLASKGTASSIQARQIKDIGGTVLITSVHGGLAKFKPGPSTSFTTLSQTDIKYFKLVVEEVPVVEPEPAPTEESLFFESGAKYRLTNPNFLLCQNANKSIVDWINLNNDGIYQGIERNGRLHLVDGNEEQIDSVKGIGFWLNENERPFFTKIKEEPEVPAQTEDAVEPDYHTELQSAIAELQDLNMKSATLTNRIANLYKKITQ